MGSASWAGAGKELEKALAAEKGAARTGGMKGLQQVLGRGRQRDIGGEKGDTRVLEEAKPCSATTELSTCDPQHSPPTLKHSTVRASGGKESQANPEQWKHSDSCLRKSKLI